MVFKTLHLAVPIKIAGTDTLPPGTWVGWDGGWVRANGTSIKAEYLLKDQGRPGEKSIACRGAVVDMQRDMPEVGTVIKLGTQRLGRVVATDCAVVEGGN